MTDGGGVRWSQMAFERNSPLVEGWQAKPEGFGGLISVSGWVAGYSLQAIH